MKGDKIYYKKGYKYQLYETYTVFINIVLPDPIITDYVQLKDGYLIISKGYAWDGASGPTIDTKSSMRGALVHDALYQLMRLGLLPISYRPKADDLLHDICVEDGMWHFRAEGWEEAVSLFAAGAARYGTEQEILAAP